MPGVALVILGLALLVFGRMRRAIGQLPHCRGCGFCLEGLTGPVRCPECGRALTAKGAVMAGRPARRRGVAAIGAVLVLGGVAWVCAYVKHVLIDAGWETRAPAWWLGEVEMRYATGTRLREAYDGLRNTSKRSADRARIVAFDRLNSHDDPARLAAVEPPLAWLAFLAVDSGLKPPIETASLVRKLVVLRPLPWSPNSAPAECQAVLMPRGWELTWSWEFVGAGGDMLLGGSGAQMAGRAWVRLTPNPPKELARVCRWSFRLVELEGALMPVEWTVEFTWPDVPQDAPEGS